MARPIVEDGDGAPSFRPLWMLMPYLWPKDRPDLRTRVLVSIVFLVLAAVLVTRCARTGGLPMLRMMGGGPEQPEAGDGHAHHAMHDSPDGGGEGPALPGHTALPG